MHNTFIEALEPRRLMAGQLDAAFRIGGVGDERITAQATDARGNVYVAGTFEGTVDFNPTSRTFAFAAADPGSPDAFVAKYSPTGGLFWARSVGRVSGASAAAPVVNSMAFDEVTGGLLLGGSFAGTINLAPSSPTAPVDPAFAFTANGGRDGFFLRLAGDTGASRLAGRLSGRRPALYSGDDAVNSIAADPDGSIVVAGTFDRHDVADGTDAFVAKYSGRGRLAWQKRYTGDGADKHVTGTTVTTGPDRAVYVSGFTPDSLQLDPGSNNTQYAVQAAGTYLTRLSGATGRPEWTGSMTVSQIADMQIDPDGNLIAAGSFQGRPDFNLDPKKTHEITGGAGNDGFVAKYAPTRGLFWVRTIGDEGGDRDEVSGDDLVTGLALGAGGDIYVGGDYYNQVYFNEAHTIGFNAGLKSGTFAARYSTAGTILNAWDVPVSPHPAQSLLTHVDAGANGSIYVSGFFSGTIDANPSSRRTFNLTSAGEYDAFVLRLV